MKKSLLICLLATIASLSFAQNSFRAGVNLGTNMESTDGYAFIAGAHADTVLLPSIGLLVGMEMDFTVDSVSWSSNPSMYVEWLTPLTLFNFMTPFVKGNLGMFVLHDKQTGSLHQSGVVASIGGGLNLSFDQHLYVAPSFSFGYPFLWSFTASAGWKF